jgi:hypothetical protein
MTLAGARLVLVIMCIPFLAQLVRCGECYRFIGNDEPWHVGSLVKYGEEREYMSMVIGIEAVFT